MWEKYLVIINCKSKGNKIGNISNEFKDTNLILQSNGLFPWKTVKEEHKARSYSKGVIKRRYGKIHR